MQVSDLGEECMVLYPDHHLGLLPQIMALDSGEQC